MQVLVAQAGELRFAKGARAGARPLIHALGKVADAGNAKETARAFRSTGFSRRSATATLLGHGEYQVQMLSMQAPGVPAGELKAAMRWKLKDVIDFPVEQATYDILVIPHTGPGSSGNLTVYAVVAKNEVIRGTLTRFAEARMPLSVIDVPETAQRNIASLYEEEGRGVALLVIDAEGALLTLTQAGELLLARRIEYSRGQIEQAQGEDRQELFERVLLAVQRTLDGFERQFSQVVIGRLLIGPETQDTGLAAYLSANLGMRVEAIDLRSEMDFARGVDFEPAAQAQFFHLIGCSLREESRQPPRQPATPRQEGRAR